MNITVKAKKRDENSLFTDYGVTLVITSDLYTRCIPFSVWRFWILKPLNNNKYSVIKSIPL